MAHMKSKRDILNKYLDKFKGGVSSVGGKIKEGVKKYKDFSAREKKLNQMASKKLGNVSSNQFNMDRFREIKTTMRRQSR